MYTQCYLSKAFQWCYPLHVTEDPTSRANLACKWNVCPLLHSTWTWSTSRELPAWYSLESQPQERPKTASEELPHSSRSIWENLLICPSPVRLLISQERYKPYPKLATRRKDAMQDLNENLNKQFPPSLLLYLYWINKCNKLSYIKISRWQQPSPSNKSLPEL